MSYQHEAGLREQIGDLERQLAEAKAEIDKWKTSYEYANQAKESAWSDIKEFKAEIERLKERLEIGFGFDMDGNRISISENLRDGIECRDETIKLLQKSVDAMRPLRRGVQGEV